MIAAPGKSVSFTAKVAPDPGFTGTITVWISGLPKGVTSTIAPANPSSLINLTVDPTTAPGTYPILVGASSNKLFSRQVATTLTIGSAPACALTASPALVPLTAGRATTVQVTCPVLNGTFSSPLTLGTGPLPAGVTAKFSAPSIVPGSTVTLTLTAARNVVLGSAAVPLTVSSSAFNQSVSLPVTIAP